MIWITNVTTLFLPFILHFVGADSEAKAKVSKSYTNPFGGHTTPRFVSFNSEDGNIDIDWDISIPFISIPINHEPGENGEPAPLLNVNTKALGIVGLITTIMTLIVPLFTKTYPEMNYRSETNMEWSQIGNTINEMIFGNNYVTPCMQRITCSIVSVASRSEHPTSTEKIIDGLSSHKWFKDVINGTIIQDAVTMGREGNHDCANIYQKCMITPRLLKTLMNQFGII